MTDIERISTWMIGTRNHLSRVITPNQETVAMTSTAVSKRIFKSQTALKWRWTNVQCIFLLNTLSGGKSCLVAPRVAVPPWANETVLSPWWRLMRTEYHTCFHTLYDEKKYIYIIYHFRSLWLSFHNYSRLCAFFWQIFLFNSFHISPRIFKSGLWFGQSFNRVTS